MNGRIGRYLAISFGWTWGCWIGAYVLSRLAGQTLDAGANIFGMLQAAMTGYAQPGQILFTLGVYGPLIASWAAGRSGRGWQAAEPGERGRRGSQAFLAVLVPLVVILPTAALSVLTGIGRGSSGGLASSPGTVLRLVFVYFLSNLVTSGTEEFGWRGFLYPRLRSREKTFWDAAWKGGLIWAAWHFPLLAILNAGAGPAVLLPTLAGFSAGIVAMNYITNFVYEQTRSLPAAMLLHALNNTASFVVLLFYPQTPFLILAHLTAWVVVGFLEKRFHLD